MVDWTVEALRECRMVRRIAVVGPPCLDGALPGADIVVPEGEGITANLFAGLAALPAGGRVLIAAADNPLVTARAYEDFLSRIPEGTAVAHPVLLRSAFLERFPSAPNICIRLRDGEWHGGMCVVIDTRFMPILETAVGRMLAARKSLFASLRLLGLGFAVRYGLRLVTSQDVERRASRIAGAPVSFVRGCDAAFPIDIDEVEDLDFLYRWAQGR
jgi:hypothetical protein